MTRCHPHRQYRRAGYSHRSYRRAAGQSGRSSAYRSFRPGRVLLIALLGAFILDGWEAAFMALAIGFPLLMTVLVITGVVTVVRLSHAARRRWYWGPPFVVPASPPVPAPRRVTDARADWRAARQRFAALRAEYAAYECDPLAVLQRPALADVTVPATARFVDAFAEAQALDTDELPPAKHMDSYRWAVDRACRAWQAAKDAAERIRLSGLSPEERASVQRVIKLLTVAKDSGNDAERLTAYAKARAELARLERSGRIHLPRPAMASLDASARAGLPASPSFTTSPAAAVSPDHLQR